LSIDDGPIEEKPYEINPENSLSIEISTPATPLIIETVRQSIKSYKEDNQAIVP